MRKVLLIACLPLFLLLLFFGQAVDAAGAEEVTLILHRRVLRDVRTPSEELYENDGLRWEDSGATEGLLKETFGLNGANFTIYDATTFYNRSSLADETFVKRYSQELSRKDALVLVKQEQLLKVATIKTQTDFASNSGGSKEDGVARVTLPAAGKRAYLIIEESIDENASVNVDLEKKASPLMLLLPQHHPVTQAKLTEVHLYPKNVGYVRDPYFFKYGKDKTTGKEEPLAGTKFVLYRLDEEGTKLYLEATAPENLQNKWISSTNPKTDEKITVFTSDEDGLVDTKERFLPSGEYYFEEIQTVADYQIHEEARKIKVEIPKSWQDEEGNFLSVMIDGQPMEELVSGIVPESVYKTATPRVYNYKKAVGQPSTRKPSMKKPGMILPQTGMRKGIGSLVGVLVILCVVGYWYQTKEKGKEND